MSAARTPAAANRYRLQAVPVRGGDLYVGVWEPESGQEPEGTLLAIHGITANHLAWQWLVEAMPKWRIIAPDLRGRGRSRDLSAPYGLTTHADDLAAVLTGLGVAGPVPVAGHSMGGFVTMVLANHYPDLVSRLVLIDGGIPVELPAGMGPEEALAAVLGPTAARLRVKFASQEAIDAFWQQHPGLARVWGPELAAYAEYDAIGEPPYLHPSTQLQAMADDTRDIQVSAALPQAMAELNHPAIFLRAQRGLQDQPEALFSAPWAAHWAEQLPALIARDIPDSNHFTILMSAEGAAQVAEELRRVD